MEGERDKRPTSNVNVSVETHPPSLSLPREEFRKATPRRTALTFATRAILTLIASCSCVWFHCSSSFSKSRLTCSMYRSTKINPDFYSTRNRVLIICRSVYLIHCVHLDHVQPVKGHVLCVCSSQYHQFKS